MRISRLELLAFGPFTQKVLDLDQGQQGLHLVYGTNEAGKSSALRALKQFLFGIPTRSPDGFLHPYSKLRIGAVLRASDGATWHAVRRKAAKSDLREADDETAADPLRLSRLLGGMDRNTFETVFGIDHPSLVAGGRTIVEGKGNLGQALFAAGSGIADLRAVQAALDEESAQLFAPQGKVRTINRLLSQVHDARRVIRESQLSSAAWEDCERSLREAQNRLNELEASLAASRREIGRLERVAEAIPEFARREHLQKRLSELGEVRILHVGFTERRLEAVTQLTVAREAANRTVKAIAGIDEELARQVVPEALAAQCEWIEKLRDGVATYQKGQIDRPGLMARKEQLIASSRGLLAELRPGLNLNDCECLRLPRVQQVRIQNLAAGRDVLHAVFESQLARVVELDERLAEAAVQVERLEAPRNAEALFAAVRRAQSYGRLEDSLNQAQSAAQAVETQLDSALRRLVPSLEGIDQLEQLPTPSSETIDWFDAQRGAAESNCAKLAQRGLELDALRTDLERRIEKLEQAGSVPSESDLDTARRLRDEGWRLLRAAFLTRSADSTGHDEYIARVGAGGDLAEAYEHAVRLADESADRLRHEAHRVAQDAHLHAELQTCLREMHEVAEAQEAAAGKSAELLETWRAAWKPSGVVPLTPREMRGWDAQRTLLLAQAASARRAECEIRQLEKQIATSSRELGNCLSALGEPPQGRHESLAALVDRAAAVADSIERANGRRQTLAAQLDEDARQRERARRRVDEAQATLAVWTEEWAEAIAGLGLPADSTPAQVNEFLAQLVQLFEDLKLAADLDSRIEGINAEAAGFDRHLRSVASDAALDITGLNTDKAAQTLIAALVIAAEAQRTAVRLNEERRRLVEELTDASQNASNAQALIEALCQEAGCADPNELPDAERASHEAKQLQSQLADADAQIARLAAGRDPRTFIEDVRAADADAVVDDLRRQREQVETWERERTEFSERVGSHKTSLADMDSSAAAADAAAKCQSLLAELATRTEEFARLRLAAVVLKESIERYRRKHQGPVLERASLLFADLTAGSFAGLRADLDEQGQPVLVGLRGDRAACGTPGETVTVGGMSDGTCDQLYLALRLASLDHYLSHHGSVPLVVDDILIKFDDERSLATLRVLAALSARTQVVLFTHHQHLLDLAQRNLDPKILFTHFMGES